MQVNKYVPLGVVALLGASVLCTPAWADEASLQRQLDVQQRTLLNQQNQIYQLQQDVNALRNEIAQLRGQGVGGVSSSVAANAALPAANNSRVVDVNEAGSGPVTPMGNDNMALNQGTPQPAASAAAANVLPGVTPEAQAAYNAAYAKVQQNDLSGAQTAFKQYVETYPNNTLTPNAWYWLGQVQYSQAIYDQARLSFLNVARYNQSQKRPDALYKLGMISKIIGDTVKAARYFQLVLQSYPHDAAATLANRELQRLQGQ